MKCTSSETSAYKISDAGKLPRSKHTNSHNLQTRDRIQYNVPQREESVSIVVMQSGTTPGTPVRLPVSD